MTTEVEWMRFFSRAGIPDGIATRYASSFVKNRVTRELLGDLDRETLSELGVTAVGDQVAIMKRVKAVAAMGAAGGGGGATAAVQKQTPRAPITIDDDDDEEEDDDDEMDDTRASVQRRGKPPPDRHEIYHVKMPEGKTAKTRRILKHAELLRQAGMHKRGTSGVRKSGRAVLSIAEQRELEEEVSSSTGDRFGGLHADRLGGVRASGKIVKRTLGAGGAIVVSGNSGLFSSAIAAARAPQPMRQKRLLVDRVQPARGSHLPSVTVHLGGGGGRLMQGRVTAPAAAGRASGLSGRVSGGRRMGGGGGGQRMGGRVQIVQGDEDDMYEDDQLEYVDEGDEEVEEVYDDGEEDEMVMEEALVVGPSRNRVRTKVFPAHGRPRHSRPARASIFDRLS